MKIKIRFNKTRGQPGRGTPDHVWRVFDPNGKEFICKHILILTKCQSEKDENGQDYNIVAEGNMGINYDESRITIY
jgi:hypothetical protein